MKMFPGLRLTNVENDNIDWLNRMTFQAEKFNAGIQVLITAHTVEGEVVTTDVPIMTLSMKIFAGLRMTYVENVNIDWINCMTFPLMYLQ